MVSVGCTADDERSGLNFILGRLLGLIIIGVAISAIGAVAQVPLVYFIAIFGILTILFGISVLFRAFNIKLKFLPISKNKPRLNHNHNPGRNPKHSAKHNPNHNDCKKPKNIKNKHVFLLGLFRGATPCLKLMILAPLLIAVDFWLAVAIVIVYAAASTIYPVIGFLFGSLLRKSERYQKHLKVAGALILIFVGIYSILNGFVLADHTRGY